MGLFSATAASRTAVISRAFSSRVPWEKLRRATSMPLRINSRIIAGALVAGPRVQTILALRRGWPLVDTTRGALINVFGVCLMLNHFVAAGLFMTQIRRAEQPMLTTKDTQDHERDTD